MDKPLFLTDNLFSTRLYPDHVLSASVEAAGFPVTRIANGRRHPDDFWTTAVLNVAAWVQSDFGRVRSFNCIVIDRNSNVAGETVELLTTFDDFTTSAQAFDFTLPAVSAPGRLDDPAGVVTEEGAWGYMFPRRSATSVRVGIDAIVTKAPEIGGLWLGLALPMPRQFDEPWEDETDELVGVRSLSDVGWQGIGYQTPKKSGAVGVRFPEELSYDLLRLNLQGMYGSGTASWLWHDQNEGHRGKCIIRPAGKQGFRLGDGWRRKRRGDINWEELAPVTE